ncbi:MAG: TIGR04076 family protein [candidate division KSB1 bacterium]|nr:TIGR04076 family protein [candidate division KSB1 bacterium]MDZ7317588.1 TIGR04076 family protein [candidate division KSB1 bacterium]MDZ7340195.1 TIGR04076 family protein [candidate division KSB1 bacterium]
MKNLIVEVAEIKQRCGANLKVGDRFEVVGQGKIVIPSAKGTCMFALQSLIPFLISKQHEDDLPEDDWIRETNRLCCPDPKGVVFKIQAQG